MSKPFIRSVSFMGLCIVLSQAVLSQDVAPTLLVERGQKPEPMLLSKLEVGVKIIGSIAETRMTMTFHNASNRQLAGDLYFPLPEGAFISGYALDINNKMVDGVVVEKAKGRRVYEALTRQRIDPGLVEWVKGNNFKTRVFPIPPNGSRTVMVRYVSEIIDDSEGPLFLLPLKFKDKVRDFSLRIEILKGDVQPIIKKSGFADFRFRKWQENYVAEISLKDASLDQDLLLQLPGVAERNVMVEKTPEDEYYFLVTDRPQRPDVRKPDIPVPPKKIAIFWDASLSRGNAGHDREFQILRSCLAHWKETDLDVELILFSNESDKPKTFTITNGNSEALIDSLEKVAYDGGTQMGTLRPLANRRRPDLYLLFSDGLSNFGQEEPPVFNAPLFFFSEDSAANHAFLHDLAGRNEGEYFNLKKLTDKQVLARIGRPPFSFIRADADRGQIEETLPRNSRPVAGRFLWVGRLLGNEAKATLTYGAGGETLVRRDYVIQKAGAVEGELLKTFWAQKKIEELMIFAKHNDKELVETGRAFGLVTPGTSLIVLDNLNQYLEYKIVPPPSLPEMRRQYFEIIEKQASELKRFEQGKIDAVLRMWNDRIAWWNTDFQKNREEKAREEKRAGAQARRERIRPVFPRRNPRLAGPGIEGKATDPEDTPLPGATISLSVGNQSWRQVTDEGGYFAFAGIPAGTFRLKAELPGFRSKIIENILFGNDSKTTVDVFLEAAALEEQVTVIGIEGFVEGGVEGGVVGGVLGGVVGEVEAPIIDAQARRVSPAKRSARFSEGNRQSEMQDAAISLQPWDPKTPYLDEIKKADPEKAHEAYLGQREKYGDSPGFYLDCADHFFSMGKKEQGLRILTNIAELELENGQMLRVLGHRLEQLELRELSASVFEDVLRLRPEEPQSYRDLALVMASLEKFERAVELLNHVVMTKWDRFPEIEVIALMEMNDIIARARKAGFKEFKVAPRLVKLLDVDIRVILTWDADMTDIDLWVTEPTEEKAFFSHNRTSIGGLVSRDVTDGYGPEEYLLRRAMRGKYKVQINYYGSRAATLTGPVTVQVDVFTNYGRPNEQHKAVTLRLKDVEEILTVTEIEF